MANLSEYNNNYGLLRCCLPPQNPINPKANPSVMVMDDPFHPSAVSEMDDPFSPITKNQKMSYAKVPLTKQTVTPIIRDGCATVKMAQTYLNSEKQNIETVYVFPLDADSTVTEYTVTTGNRTLYGTVKEKDVAEKEYNTAVSQGKLASKMDQHENNIFIMKVGNIEPEKEITVTITYVTEIKLLSNKFRFVLPTYVAPRYESKATDATPNPMPNMNYKSGDLSYKLDIVMSCEMGSQINEITSTTHKLEVTSKGNNATVKLSKADMNKDVVIFIETADPFKFKALTEYTEGKEGPMLTAMVHLTPTDNVDAKGQEQKNEFIFVCDQSGSMWEASCGGKSQKIDDMEKASLFLLQSIPTDCYINFIGFGSTYKSLFPTSRKFDEKTKALAIAFVTTMKTEQMGGTELFEPIKFIATLPLIEGYDRQIFVMTDGQITSPDEVSNFISASMKNMRVFSLGMGDSVDRNLIEKLARSGKGTCRFCVETDKIDEMLTSQLKDSLYPTLSDISIEWNNSASVPIVQTPYIINSISREQGLTVYGIMENCKKEDISKLTKVTMKAKTNKGVEVSYTTNITATNTNVVSGIGKLAVRSLIRDLDEGTSLLHKLKSSATQIKTELINTSKKHSILSKYTSFVMVDERAPEKVVSMTQIVIPVHVPAHSYPAAAAAACPASYNSYFGVKTAGSTLKNASHNLRGPPPAPYYRAAKSAVAAAAAAPVYRNQRAAVAAAGPADDFDLFSSSSFTPTRAASNDWFGADSNDKMCDMMSSGEKLECLVDKCDDIGPNVLAQLDSQKFKISKGTGGNNIWDGMKNWFSGSSGKEDKKGSDRRKREESTVENRKAIRTDADKAKPAVVQSQYVNDIDTMIKQQEFNGSVKLDNLMKVIKVDKAKFLESMKKLTITNELLVSTILFVCYMNMKFPDLVLGKYEPAMKKSISWIDATCMANVKKTIMTEMSSFAVVA